MKNTLSIFILSCIFMGSFYAQNENSSFGNNIAVIQSNFPISGEPSHHKNPILNEITSETEDTETKQHIDQLFNLFDASFSQKHFNNSHILLKDYYPSDIIVNSIQLFLKNRNILI